MTTALKLSTIALTAALGAPATYAEEAITAPATTNVVNVTTPSRKILMQSEPYCWEELGGLKQSCLTSRVVEDHVTIVEGQGKEARLRSVPKLFSIAEICSTSFGEGTCRTTKVLIGDSSVKDNQVGDQPALTPQVK